MKSTFGTPHKNGNRHHVYPEKPEAHVVDPIYKAAAVEKAGKVTVVL
jgi:hypothetical protein